MIEMGNAGMENGGAVCGNAGMESSCGNAGMDRMAGPARPAEVCQVWDYGGKMYQKLPFLLCG